MKTFAIAVVTADGFITRSSHDTVTWSSPEDKAWFHKRTKEAGVIIMGAATYRVNQKPMEGRKTIVYSHTLEHEPGIEITQENPQVLLGRLEAEGYDEVAIGGGAQIYTMFMEAGLIDTLYLTVEPILFGKGISLFTKSMERQLELQSADRLNQHTMLFEYKVIQ